MRFMPAQGEGWTISSIDDLGDGPGFRKIRGPLGVSAFGVNAIVLPPKVETGTHWHDEQDELYFVHRGHVRITFGDGTTEVLEPGGIAHVEASVQRRIANVGSEDAVFVIVGGKDGYVGRDGRAPEGDPGVHLIED
jgi:quercetin dioxygenase-like cupin family protein